MTESVSTDAIRASALALLASGNSLESVAHVFGVPLERLREWAAQPSISTLPAAAPFPAPAVQRPWLSFPTTTVYALGPMGRSAMLALGLIVAGCPVLAWPFVSAPPTKTGSLLLFLLAALVCFGLTACAILAARNTRFELRPHAIAKWTLSGICILPFSKIVGATTSRQGKSASWSVVLQTSEGTPPMTLHPEDAHLRDPALVAWLNSIPLRDGDPVRPRDESATSGTGRVMLWFVNALLAAMMLLFLRMPVDTGRALLAGYPPLQQLSVTDGTLTRVERCYRPRRGASYLLVDVRTTAGTQPQRVECTFDGGVLARPGAHHITIWRDTRTFSNNAVRQVDLDGRTLQDYAAFIARSRRFDPAMFVWEIMMSAVMALLARGAYLSGRGDD